YTAIPVFLSRSFRHGAIYVRADAGIERPQDLRGRRVGVPEWQLTANVWARGMLSDEYGVAVEQIEWLIGGLDQPGRKEKHPVELPPRINHASIGADQTLWSLMCEGALDAIIAPRAPQALVKGDPRVRRLFTDFKSAEQAYFRKTGIFPIMHVLELPADRHPFFIATQAHPELTSRPLKPQPMFVGLIRAALQYSGVTHQSAQKVRARRSDPRDSVGTTTASA
ncbi:MAG: hypothetical protein IIA49_10960, partial [Bacteroidetes bacterium]|nr:hypothetical protein [Bacteroidota bacterium]